MPIISADDYQETDDPCMFVYVGNDPTMPSALAGRPGQSLADLVAEINRDMSAPQLTTPQMPELQPYQFFAMLEISGKKAALDAFIDALPAPQNIVARTKLDKSLAFHRDNDLVLAAQQALGLTNDQLDALWTQAASL